jgi:hypothetical protein
MKTALIMLRKETHYRSNAFVAGLKKHGFAITTDHNHKPKAEDVVVQWNRMAGPNDALATQWEKAGARVIVSENGYIGKDADGHQYYALALSGHNGSGRWYAGDEDRWSKLGITMKPWRIPQSFGERYLLIAGQRGIGSPTMRSPERWHIEVEKALRNASAHYKVKVRPHPGNNLPPPNSLESDFAGAFGVIIWSSSTGVKALVEGLPVTYAAPYWICSEAATRYKGPGKMMLNYTAADRETAFARMAWAQWSLAELTEGTAFDALLNSQPNCGVLP